MQGNRKGNKTHQLIQKIQNNTEVEQQDTFNFNQPLASEGNDKQATWQKVSSNNKELQRLFYQLPAGTKNLVQSAI